MKTIQLELPFQEPEQSIEDLLRQAQTEELLLKLPDGRTFKLSFVPKIAKAEQTAEADFETELEQQRNNSELMEFLDKREKSIKQTFSLDEVKARLGLS